MALCFIALGEINAQSEDYAKYYNKANSLSESDFEKAEKNYRVAINDSLADLKDTAINPVDGSSTLFSVSGSAILRLKNSGGYVAYNATANSGYIQPDTRYRHTNSGVSWKFYNPGQYYLSLFFV